MKINPEGKKVTELRTSSSLSEEESSRNQNTNMTQATVQPQANGENVQRTNSIVKVKLSLAELILSHKYFTWTMTAWTVWALFGDDLRILMTLGVNTETPTYSGLGKPECCSKNKYYCKF